MSPASFLRRLLWPADPGAFRLWLALLVVLHHLSGIEFGKAPVLAFFLLSGFWVHKVWCDRYARSRAPWLTFLVSRWWRVAPILILATPLAIAMQAITRDTDLAIVAQTPWRQLLVPFSVLGYAQLPTRPVGPAWSLDIEMQFYLVAPLLVLLVRRWSAAMVLMAGYLVFEWSLMAGHGVVLTAFLPWFLLGMVAAEHGWTPTPGIARGSFAVTVGLVLAVLATPSLYATYLAPHAPEYATFNMLIGALILPFALATVARPDGAPRPDRADAMLADQSYLVYMLHWPPITLYRHIPWATPAAAFAGAVLLLALVGCLCLFVWRAYDRPLDAMRKRWVAARRAMPHAGAEIDAIPSAPGNPPAMTLSRGRISS